MKYLLLITLFISCNIHAQTQYKISSLGSLSGQGSLAYGLNSNGMVVGQSFNAVTGKTEAVVWNNGLIQSLGFEGLARDVNHSGTVVGVTGTAKLGNPDGRAFSWQSGIYNDLGDLGGPHSGAYAINDAGTITGVSLTSNTGPNDPVLYTHAFRYENGGMTDLGSVSSPQGYSRGHAINELGVIAGRASLLEFDNSNKHAAIWDDSNNITSLPSDFVYSTVQDINDNGLLVGNGYDANNNMRAVVIDESGEFTFLDSNGGNDNRAFAVNNDGVIVGHTNDLGCQPPFCFTKHATISYDGKTILQLGDLVADMDGWISLDNAYDINNAGFIVGVGTSVTGEAQAFLLTPVPLPATAWLFFSGLALLFRLKIKQAAG